MLPQDSATLTVGNDHYTGIKLHLETGEASPARGTLRADTAVLSAAAWAGIVTITVAPGDERRMIVSRYRTGDLHAQVELVH